MHEMAIACELLQMVKKETERPVRVHCRLGMMTTYKPEPLRFYFNELYGDGAPELCITEVLGLLKCDDCLAESRVDDPYDMYCPGCGSGNTRLIDGKDLVIERIEVE
ncbi:MAG: hydrogenase maturation nickel metallochaperone HypA [Candidatus Woesearchaeota archaeon]